MAEINSFNFRDFDIGGSGGAVANDGKLTGEEVKKAREAGWTVWDEFREGDKVEYVGKNENIVVKFFRTRTNMFKSETYKEYSKLKDKLLEEKLAKFGIYPAEIKGEKVYHVDTVLFDERYKKAKEEAEKEAKEQLGLDPNAFSLLKKLQKSTDKKDNKISQEKEIPKETPKIKDQAKVDKDFNSINFSITDPKEAEAKKIAQELQQALQKPNDFYTRGWILGTFSSMPPEYTSIVLKYVPDLVQQLDKIDYKGRGLDVQDIVKCFGLPLLDRYNMVFPNQTDYTKEFFESITDIQQLSDVLKTMANEINDADFYKVANNGLEAANKTIAEAANMEPKLEVKRGSNEGGDYKRVTLPDGRLITVYYHMGQLQNIQISTIPEETEFHGEKGDWHEVLYNEDFVGEMIDGHFPYLQDASYDFNAIKNLCKKIFGESIETF